MALIKQDPASDNSSSQVATLSGAAEHWILFSSGHIQEGVPKDTDG
jgi:hypothetical protein